MKKKPWRYYHFTYVYHEWQSYDVWFQKHGVQQAKSFLILDHFLSKFWKKSLEIASKFWKKIAWRYHQLTLVYHKWQSYDVWFLRYKVLWTEFFVDYILPFWHSPSLKTWKIKILLKWKKIKFPGDIRICTING